MVAPNWMDPMRKSLKTFGRKNNGFIICNPFLINSRAPLFDVFSVTSSLSNLVTYSAKTLLSKFFAEYKYDKSYNIIVKLFIRY